VVIVIGGTPVCRGKSVVYKRYYKTPSFVNAVLLSCSEASSSRLLRPAVSGKPAKPGADW
jgi:hypothetical protein